MMLRRLISSMLGLLLLAAAVLKLYGLSVAPFAQYGRLMNPSVQFAAVEWEIVLGIWLLTGRQPFAAWFAALLTFLTFAGVSLYLGLIGQASCGCFGSLKASPWHAFAVDIMAMVLFGIARPDLHYLRQFDSTQWRMATLCGFGLAAGVVAVTAGIVGLTTLAFGSPDAALARLRGERVSIRPIFVDMGRGQPGQTKEAVVEIVNRTDQPVSVIGGTSDCSCVAVQDLPLTPEPGEVRRVSVRLRLPGEAGFFDRRAFFWVKCGRTWAVSFGLTGRINPAARQSAAVAIGK